MAKQSSDSPAQTQKRKTAERLRERAKHARENALDAIHTLEDSALDAYHAIEDHNTAELKQDVRYVLTALANWSKSNVQRVKSWYLKQPPALRIIYGVTVIPIMALLGLLTFVLIKFGGPILLILLLGSKFVIAFVKIFIFIGYIGYKILKTILMWYYTISRLYSGGKAKRQRRKTAHDCSFNVTPATANDSLRFHCKRKDLYIQQDGGYQLRILFSYLRYALIGQLNLLRHCKNSWRYYLTLWRAQSRALIKTEIAPVGASLFTPHTLGADINDERVLVPGDAELIEIIVKPAHTLDLRFRICWVDWHFAFNKSLKPLKISREHQETIWQVDNVALSAESSAELVTEK